MCFLMNYHAGRPAHLTYTRSEPKAIWTPASPRWCGARHRTHDEAASDFLRNLRVRLCARRDRDALRSHRLHLRGHGARALALVRAGRGAQAQGAARRGWEQRGGLTEYLALLARLAQGGGVFCW